MQYEKLEGGQPVVTACPGDERLKIAIRPPPAASRQPPAAGRRLAVGTAAGMTVRKI
jgi:hypothetical protein